MTYDGDGRLAQIQQPSGAQIQYGFDAGGRQVTTTIPSGVYAYQYDPQTGNPSQVAAPGGDTVRYEYDGRLVTQAAWAGPVTGTVSWAYNNDFWVTSQTVAGTSPIAYAYDADGVPTTVGALTLTRDGATGQLTSTTIGSVTSQNGFNTFGEPTQFTVTYSGQPIFSLSDVQDAAGRRTARTETVGGVTTTYGFGYDGAGRLSSVTRAGAPYVSYEYDQNGNRTREINSNGVIVSSYDAQDRLVTSGDLSYTFTPDGFLASSQASGAADAQYRSDALGNLLGVTLPSGQQISYVVDGENRRVGRMVDGVLVQGFLYSGRRAIVAELDGANNVVSRFVWAESELVPAYMIKGGVTYRLVSELSGTVRLVVDVATGAIAQRLDYDPFGRVVLDTRPGFQPFGFKGGLYDPATGLVHTRARDYDPNTGRWIAKDPTLFGGQNTNVYAFADGDPVNHVDPDGEFSLIEFGTSFAMNVILEKINKSPLGGAVPAIKALHKLYMFMHSAELKALETQVIVLNKFLDTWGRYDDASPDFEDHIAQAMTNYQQAYAAVAQLAGETAKGMEQDIVGAYVPGIKDNPLAKCLLSLTGATPGHWTLYKDNPSVPGMLFQSCVVDQFWDAVDGALKPFFGTSVLGVALQKTIMDELRP